MDASSTLKRARETAGLGTTELAARIGVTKGLVTHIEKGRSDPSVRTLNAWLSACGYELAVIPAGGAMSTSDAELVDMLRAALASGVVDERRKRFLRMELAEYMADVQTKKATG